MELNWMGGSTAEHPMADAKQARELVEGLPAGDSVAALQQITEWIASLNESDGFKVNRRFDLVDLLDGAAKNHHRKLCQDYLTTPRQQKYQENRLWNGVFRYWKQVGEAYVVCIREHESGFNAITAIRRSLPVMVARALRALTAQLKWALLRYGPVEPRIWSEIARLYRFAEQRGMAEGAIAIYAGEQGTSTLQREFLKAVMLGASSTDGLLPLRQEIAERAVTHFAGAFRLSAQPEGCTHCFDLARAAPPVRLFRGVKPPETLRFFAAGDGLAELRRLAAKISETGGIPADVNLGGSYDKELVAGVFKYLAQTWSDRPSARGAVRRQTAGRITVVPGLGEILGTLEPPPQDDLDFSFQPSAESWIVENVSDGGYGAIIPARKSDWLRVGTLVAVKGETADYWAIGLVRRISSDEHQQRHVGIQLLTKAAIPIRVARIAEITSLNFSDREPQLSAILLTTDPDERGEIGVVLASGALNGCDGLEMTVREKNYILMTTCIVEGGEDFQWAKFKVMQMK